MIIKLSLTVLIILLNSFVLSKGETTDSAQLIYQQTIRTSKANSIEKVQAYYNYGVWLDENNKKNESINELYKALEIAQALNNHTKIARIANYIGAIYWEIGDYKKSTQLYLIGLESAKLCENRSMLSTLLINISGNYNSKGQSTTAIEHALTAIKIKEEDKLLNDICFDYMTVAEIFKESGDEQKWEQYTQKAYLLSSTDSCASFESLIMIYNNLGQIALEKNKYKLSLSYYDTLYIISDKKNHDQGKGIALINSALVYKTKNEPDTALQLVSESIQYFGEVPYFLMAAQNTEAGLLKEMKRYNEALKLVEDNINNEHIKYYPTLKNECLYMLYSINVAIENYKQAFAWNDSLMAYKEKLQKEENLKNIEELETKYETEKKEQQIDLLSASNKIKNQRIELFITITIALLLLLIVGALLYYRRKKQNEQKQEQLKQQLLRSQMNPHFLFNALGSIQNFMLRNETQKAAGYLGNFAALTRSILEHSATESITLEDEIKSLRNYIELEKMRLKNRFDYSFIFDNDLETEFIMIPPMLIQPFIENAIKHGFKNLNYNGELKIEFIDNVNTLKTIVTDNGNGFNSKKTSKKDHKSMAMDIFKQRIDLFKKEHKKEISFIIESNEGKGTKVVIDIPIIG
ncbi:MAG: histidine kinase [Marinilabiliaceae bacterium]|nr:histidine kinase [Marinilabiliaceae bacterium]